jgi:hypothetical protein
MDRRPVCKPGATLRAAMVTAVLTVIAALGCSGAEGNCEDLCAMEAECASNGSNPDTDAIPFDEAGCRQTCFELAEQDPGFADGVSSRVDCLEEQLDQGNGCFPCPVEG